MDMHADIPLDFFNEHSLAVVEQLRQTQRTVTLTVDGKAAAIVQDPVSHQRLLDLAAQSSAEEGIRQGVADIAAGRVRPAQDVFDEIRAKHGIPR